MALAARYGAALHETLTVTAGPVTGGKPAGGATPHTTMGRQSDFRWTGLTQEMKGVYRPTGSGIFCAFSADPPGRGLQARRKNIL